MNGYVTPAAIAAIAAIAAAMHIEDVAQSLNGVAPPQSLDYLELFSESDIKRAVAFFRISFSSSTRFSFRSSSWIRS